MGVSLQIYRIRIGTFNPSVRVKTGKEHFTKSSTLIYWNLRIGIFLLILLSFTSLMFVLSSQLKYLPKSSKCMLRATSPPCNGQICSSRCPPWTLPPWPSKPPSQTLPASSSPISLSRPSNNHNHRPLTSSKETNFYARMTFGNRAQRGHGIKIMHWNKGPSYLINKHHDIEAMIAGHKPHVLGLSEANIRHDHDLSLVQHEEYTLHICPTIDNPKLKMSRIVVYTHKSLVVKRRHDLEDDSVSAIWLEAGLPNQKKIVICQAYREWKYLGQDDGSSSTINAQLSRWSRLLDMWEKALNEGKEVIAMMDANIDFCKWTRSDLPISDNTRRLRPLIELLFSKIFPHGVSQLVSVPTRVWPGQQDAGLDHLYSNRPDKLSEVYAEFSGGSDHKLIKVTRYAKTLQKSVRYVKKRSFKHFVESDFCSAVKNLSWWEVYSCDCAQQAAEVFTEKINNILDKMAPVRTFQVRVKYAAWLSEGTKDLIKKRDSAQATAAHTKDPDDWRFYKNLRNTVNSKKKWEKKIWEQKKLDCSEHNPSTIWKNVKGWLKWGKSGPPQQLFHNGNLVNSPAGLAGTMNMFFINKVKLLRSSIPDTNSDPLYKLRDSMKDRDSTLKFKAVHPKEIRNIISKLKNSKSTGVDNIDTRIIKLVAADILPAITHVVNLSITQSVFPQGWKQAKVIPLLKKGDPMVPKNYRPVALLPILSKILERVIFNQLVHYLDTHGLLHPNHHGSRHGHSTATALIQMYDNWIQEVDRGNMVGVMMVDLSAAFDMVDHPLLLQKLKLLGLEDDSLAWMNSYLSGRSQSVLVDGCLSPPLDVECGVPQGSILGPLLYIIFTNDIPDLVHQHSVSYKDQPSSCQGCGSTVCYVDDATYSIGSPDPVELSNNLTSQYNTISKYMASNKLIINAEKTHLVVMAKQGQGGARDRVVLQAGGHIIKPVRSERLLGCNISQDLKWKEHLMTNDSSLIKQLTSRVNGLSLLSPRATFKTRLMVANGIVIAQLCYMIQLWGGCEGYLLNSLQVLMNRAARCVTRSSSFTPTRKLLSACNWLSVRQLVFYQTVVMVHKMIKTGLPKPVSSKLLVSFPYQTRQATNGSIRYGDFLATNTSLIQSSFTNRGVKNYNMIPTSIRTSMSMSSFKTKLKRWISDNINIS